MRRSIGQLLRRHGRERKQRGWWYRSDAPPTDGIAFDCEALDSPSFGGEVVGHWWWGTGHGEGVSGRKDHLRENSTCQGISLSG